ncbi:MAG: metallophosphoesterase [Nitrospirales bacterium]|nr:metallophosphoesterase [Nitrospirales bacterium]
MISDPIPKQACRLKKDEVVTIAHLSDLHFTSKTSLEAPHLASLQEELANENVDMIVVSGDIATCPLKDVFISCWDLKPTPTDLKNVLELKKAETETWLKELEGTFNLAHSFFKGLCETSGVDYPACLRVVPGNHDLRIHPDSFFPKPKGFFRRKEDPIELVVDPADNTFQRIFSDFAGDQQLNFSHPKKTDNPSFDLAVLCFNSNSSDPIRNFATGKVSEENLEKLRTLDNFYPEFKKVTKIVLMHHHPMPIPLSGGREGILENDPFLVVQNTGIVMRDLVRAKIHLVLHGHKHYSGFSHTTYPLTSDDTHGISILGAGSSGTYCEGFHFNLVQLYQGGQVFVTEKRRDHTGGYVDKRKFWLTPATAPGNAK